MGVVLRPIKKSKLELSLLTGGSLLPNTKYYVFCVGSTQSSMREGAAASPLSDTFEITTTSTELSISIHNIWEGDILTFSDNGDGTTRVYSPKHTLKNGDAITILGTTNYNGNYNAIVGIATYKTEEEYHYFYIDTPFVVNETGTWISDDINRGIFGAKGGCRKNNN